MKKFAKFWKAANFRLKFGLIVTLIFFIIGFVVYYVPHVNPFTFNTYPNKLGASAEHCWHYQYGSGCCVAAD